MPLRAFTPPPATDPSTNESSQPERRSVWRTSLLLLTSAAFGGIAVAIWNRRTLALIRQQGEHADAPSFGADAEP